MGNFIRNIFGDFSLFGQKPKNKRIPIRDDSEEQFYSTMVSEDGIFEVSVTKVIGNPEYRAKECYEVCIGGRNCTKIPLGPYGGTRNSADEAYKEVASHFKQAKAALKRPVNLKVAYYEDKWTKDSKDLPEEAQRVKSRIEELANSIRSELAI